jgi:hypothetical protein
LTRPPLTIYDVAKSTNVPLPIVDEWNHLALGVKSMHEYTGKIRDFIDEPRALYALLKNQGLLHQLCSCLDAVEDTELAMASYSAREFTASDGALYLAVYGLLQAFFLQQDAVLNMCESLGIPETLDNYPKLKEIREIRHATVGHPTKKERPQPTSYHSISRPTLSADGFELLSYRGDGTFDAKYISIPDLIAERRSYVSQILASVIDELQRREANHKEKFKMEKLAAIFPPSLSYSLGKIIVECTEAGRAPVLAGPGIREVKRLLQTFRDALARRDIEIGTYDSIKQIY